MDLSKACGPAQSNTQCTGDKKEWHDDEGTAIFFNLETFQWIQVKFALLDIQSRVQQCNFLSQHAVNQDVQ